MKRTRSLVTREHQSQSMFTPRLSQGSMLEKQKITGYRKKHGVASRFFKWWRSSAAHAVLCIQKFFLRRERYLQPVAMFCRIGSFEKFHFISTLNFVTSISRNSLLYYTKNSTSSLAWTVNDPYLAIAFSGYYCV